MEGALVHGQLLSLIGQLVVMLAGIAFILQARRLGGRLLLAGGALLIFGALAPAILR